MLRDLVRNNARNVAWVEKEGKEEKQEKTPFPFLPSPPSPHLPYSGCARSCKHVARDAIFDVVCDVSRDVASDVGSMLSAIVLVMCAMLVLPPSPPPLPPSLTHYDHTILPCSFICGSEASGLSIGVRFSLKVIQRREKVIFCQGVLSVPRQDLYLSLSSDNEKHLRFVA